MDAQRDVFEEIRAREQLAQRREVEHKQHALDLYNVMRTEEGRRLMYHILKDCGTDALSFHTNALTMAFNEGKRAIGVTLVEQLRQACNDFYLTMLEEQSGEHQ